MEMPVNPNIARLEAMSDARKGVAALNAVRELCMEAAGHQIGNTLGEVNADHFASLLEIIMDHMTVALNELSGSH